MKPLGLAEAAGLVGSHQVACLQDWLQAAAADLTLVEALQGTPLDPNHSLATALPGIFVFDPSGRPFLSRYASKAGPCCVLRICHGMHDRYNRNNLDRAGCLVAEC